MLFRGAVFFFCSRLLLLLVVEDGVEELEDELLLFSREQFDLFELSLELRGRTQKEWGHL
jgi:hypothetical protein